MFIMLWSCNAAWEERYVSDGCVWRCPQCKTTKTLREHSFFHEVQDAPEEVASVVALLGAAKDASEEVMVDNCTVCDVYR